MDEQGCLDGFVGRMEVVSGRTGRRNWPDDVKARIVSESFRPGTVVNDVARRHGLTPQQLTHWRRATRDGFLVLPDASQILMSIPGVGAQTAAKAAAAVDDVGRFKSSRSVGAYFGLVPKRHQTGELDWVGRITTQGDVMVRKLLYEAVNAIITRRLGVIMHAMLRDGTLFEA
ncbi:transposase [Amorphus sp. MBR-141]